MGGGTVYFPPGEYLTGSFIMKESVTLYIEAGATILGSQNIDDYVSIHPEYEALRTNGKATQLIYAEKSNNI